jgi:hypothetical protein
MENVLETYAEAYDPQQPVLCMDEQPVQLLKETKVPIAATGLLPAFWSTPNGSFLNGCQRVQPLNWMVSLWNLCGRIPR